LSRLFFIRFTLCARKCFQRRLNRICSPFRRNMFFSAVHFNSRNIIADQEWHFATRNVLSCVARWQFAGSNSILLITRAVSSTMLYVSIFGTASRSSRRAFSRPPPCPLISGYDLSAPASDRYHQANQLGPARVVSREQICAP